MSNTVSSLSAARAAIETAGYRFDDLRSFVDENGYGYGFSYESDRSCMGQPRMQVRVWPAIDGEQ